MPPPESRTETWRSIKPGDNLIISDEATIKQRMAENKGPTPETYQVAFRLSVKNKLAEWIFMCLSESKGLFLLAKLVDKTVSLALYTENSDWSPGTRLEILESGRTFLFPDADPAKASEINSFLYAKDIENGEGDDQITYLQKGQGEQSGSVYYNPLQSGVSDHIATIVEYATAADLQAPPPETELLFLESGQANSGVIKMLLGRPMKVSDVKVMH